jgi:hypothetical protein
MCQFESDRGHHLTILAACMSKAENDHHPIQSALAKALAVTCVRNTFLEDLHAGKTPRTLTGDFSDVKVITPSGEISWNDVSRISNDEMQRLMKEVVNKLFTALVRIDDPEFLKSLDSLSEQYIANWDEPDFLPTFITGTKK